MATASIRRERKWLLLLSPISKRSFIAPRSEILSERLRPAEIRTISTQAVKSWVNLQASQIRTEYPHGSWQPFNASIKGHTSPFSLSLCRSFSSNINQLPAITDPEIEAAVKDLLAINWDEIPDSVINETKRALSKTTDNKAGQEVLANVFRAATASVEFGGVLVSLRMALDDLCGLSGENVGHLPEHLEDAIRAAYKRYVTYLDSFGPDETYLRKKVELELGTKMMHLKMRCSGIGSEWGKVTLIGTSGLSGSYVELRA